MDINAGRIVTEGLTVQEMGEICIQEFIEVLNGKLTVCEQKGNGGIVGFHRAAVPFA